jgi:hypothetical protein
MHINDYYTKLTVVFSSGWVRPALKNADGQKNFLYFFPLFSTSYNLAIFAFLNHGSLASLPGCIG